MNILASYASQFQWNGAGLKTAISQPDYTRLIEARAVWFGAMIGASQGEPFLVSGPVALRELPVIDNVVPTEGDFPPFCMFR